MDNLKKWIPVSVIVFSLLLTGVAVDQQTFSQADDTKAEKLKNLKQQGDDRFDRVWEKVGRPPGPWLWRLKDKVQKFNDQGDD
jgi:ABC-type cobalt transport system substrate-binding protein